MWEKKQLLVTSISSFFHIVFYFSGKHSVILIEFKVVVCKLSQFGRI